MALNRRAYRRTDVSRKILAGKKPKKKADILSASSTEAKGFEPLEPSQVQRFSRPPLSTTQPHLHRPIYAICNPFARKIFKKMNPPRLGGAIPSLKPAPPRQNGDGVPAKRAGERSGCPQNGRGIGQDREECGIIIPCSESAGCRRPYLCHELRSHARCPVSLC